MKSETNVSDLRTPDELVAWLRVKKDWLYQRISAGTLPFPYVKVGNHLRFPAAGVEKWLQSQTRA